MAASTANSQSTKLTTYLVLMVKDEEMGIRTTTLTKRLYSISLSWQRLYLFCHGAKEPGNSLKICTFQSAYPISLKGKTVQKVSLVRCPKQWNIKYSMLWKKWFWTEGYKAKILYRRFMICVQVRNYFYYWYGYWSVHMWQNSSWHFPPMQTIRERFRKLLQCYNAILGLLCQSKYWMTVNTDWKLQGHSK